MSYSIADRARFFLWNALICFVDPVWIRIEVRRRREERGQQLGSKALIRENLQGVGFFECASISVTGRRTMKKIIPSNPSSDRCLRPAVLPSGDKR